MAGGAADRQAAEHGAGQGAQGGGAGPGERQQLLVVQEQGRQGEIPTKEVNTQKAQCTSDIVN